MAEAIGLAGEVGGILAARQHESPTMPARTSSLILAAGLMGVACLAAASRPAQAWESMVCVQHAGGYVARVTVAERLQDFPWREQYTRTLTLGTDLCHKTHYRREVRFNVEVHSGFEWRRACRERFDAGVSGTLRLTGTSVDPGCRRG